ncbi:MAG TPA: phage holin family protein [Enterovirga sp.]|jgi:uncharacterized membrane protein YqjE|nr:phage holin family protein [Enterovirga sp.]
MPDRQGASLQTLVADAIRDAADLFRQEFALFRTEMSENVSAVVKGAVFFAAAAVLAIASVIWLTQALVYAIDLFVHSMWLSALIVGVLLLAGAGALAMVGKNRMSAATLAPTRTVRSLKRDTEVLSERISG